MKDKTKTVFIGVDTHKETHTFCAINCFQEVIYTLEIPNDFSTFDDSLNKLLKKIPKDFFVVFGLEDTGGNGRTLAQFLNTEGFETRQINPIKTNRKRKLKVTPEKSDPKDALDIAKVLLEERETLPLQGST